MFATLSTSESTGGQWGGQAFYPPILVHPYQHKRYQRLKIFFYHSAIFLSLCFFGQLPGILVSSLEVILPAPLALDYVCVP